MQLVIVVCFQVALETYIVHVQLVGVFSFFYYIRYIHVQLVVVFLILAA